MPFRLLPWYKKWLQLFLSRLFLTLLYIKVKAHNTMEVIRKCQLLLLTGILIGTLNLNTSRILKPFIKKNKKQKNKKSLYLSAYKMTSEYFKNANRKSGQKNSWLCFKIVHLGIKRQKILWSFEWKCILTNWKTIFLSFSENEWLQAILH